MDQSGRDFTLSRNGDCRDLEEGWALPISQPASSDDLSVGRLVTSNGRGGTTRWWHMDGRVDADGDGNLSAFQRTDGRRDEARKRCSLGSRVDTSVSSD
jgi:hypothetical protein